MILIFSVLFYPIFFILLYAIGEYILPTRNGAMIFAICGGFICSYLYYTIRSKVSQLRKRKTHHKNRKKAVLTGLLLLSEDQFKKHFPFALADNSYNGLNEEKLLCYLRNNPAKQHLHIYSVKGLTSGCQDLLNLLKIEYTLHTQEDIIDKTITAEIPNVAIEQKTPKLTSLLNAVFSKQFEKFALKYGVILILISIITPYKMYYIISGSILAIYSIILKVLRRFNQQNRIPYLRS